jgi:RimJ/RimL family protein N-acetyltransferase
MSLFDLAALRGHSVYLLPLRSRDKEKLKPLARDERIWEFTKTLLIDEHFDRQFDDYFELAIRLPETGNQAFVIYCVSDDAIIGMTRTFNIDPKERRLEIGHTWYIPSVWSQVYNKECKLLLLQYIFETLKFNRVQFNVAHQNIRSQRAVEKIGGVKEGILRKHMVRNDGTRRDTVVFSIIDEEWPEKKKRLLQLIAGYATA